MRHAISELDLQPHTEGSTHIRVGMASRTQLGRLLANEAYTPFVHDQFGRFESLEGFWAFVSSGGARNPLRAPSNAREVYGIAAQKLTMQTNKRHTPLFRSLICEGLECKILQSLDLKTLLRENDLELVRYDVLEQETLLNPQQRWFMEHLAKIVKRLKCQKPK